MTTTEVLIQARAEVSHGWCKHLMHDSRGNVCAVGAVARVCKHRNHEYLAAVGQLEKVLPEFAVSVQMFNDCAATWKTDVLALFDRAIAAAVPVGDPAHVFAVAS